MGEWLGWLKAMQLVIFYYVSRPTLFFTLASETVQEMYQHIVIVSKPQQGLELEPVGPKNSTNVYI